jgi:predicted phage baseplate assembly protein
VTQLLSAAAAGEVTNPEPASGGADVEVLGQALRRGPALLRHRRLALTEQDVEAIALEVSPAVVRVRALGAQDRFGRSQPGAVRVIVVPRDGTARPQPGPALLAQVHDALAVAVPVVAVRGITVEGPSYAPIGVSLTVIPRRADDAGPVRERVLTTLEQFLHPLAGGPDETGWELGRGVYVSDVARVLEAVAGVDALQDLVLMRDGALVGDAAPVGPADVVCAGDLVLRLGGA